MAGQTARSIRPTPPHLFHPPATTRAEMAFTRYPPDAHSIQKIAGNKKMPVVLVSTISASSSPSAAAHAAPRRFARLAHTVPAGLAVGLGRARRRGRKQRRQRLQNQQRLQDRQPCEGITKGADGQQQHGNRRSQGGLRPCAIRRVTPRSPHPGETLYQQIDAHQGEPEDDTRQSARRCQRLPRSRGIEPVPAAATPAARRRD